MTNNLTIFELHRQNYAVMDEAMNGGVIERCIESFQKGHSNETSQYRALSFSKESHALTNFQNVQRGIHE